MLHAIFSTNGESQISTFRGVRVSVLNNVGIRTLVDNVYKYDTYCILIYTLF